MTRTTRTTTRWTTTEATRTRVEPGSGEQSISYSACLHTSRETHALVIAAAVAAPADNGELTAVKNM